MSQGGLHDGPVRSWFALLHNTRSQGLMSMFHPIEATYEMNMWDHIFQMNMNLGQFIIIWWAVSFLLIWLKSSEFAHFRCAEGDVTLV